MFASSAETGYTWPSFTQPVVENCMGDNLGEDEGPWAGMSTHGSDTPLAVRVGRLMAEYIFLSLIHLKEFWALTDSFPFLISIST